MSKTTDLIVIKVGTLLLTTENNLLDLNNLRNITRQIIQLIETHGKKVVLVTSGAITCGSEHMETQANSIPEKQAAAAVGQILLLQQYFHFFQEHGKKIGQILLTKDALEDPDRRQHARNTIDTLLSNEITPIINENDTVAVDEIRFGDNDELSAQVAELIGADQLILLTSTDGVYTNDPKQKDAKKIDVLDEITEDVLGYANDQPNSKSRGGMRSKLLSAQFASRHGVDVTIANGRETHVLEAIILGKVVGTQIKGVR